MVSDPKEAHLDGATPMRGFAQRQIALRLAKLGERVERAAAADDAATIHDLRVALRRFGQAMLLFASLLPKKEVKRIRKRVKDTMSLTSQVRNRDIALEHLAGLEEALVGGIAAERLKSERAKHLKQVRETLAKWRERDFTARWSAALELESR